MAEMRAQARAAADGGEVEVAEALWQLIQQSLPDDAEAKDALAVIEKAKLKEAKAQGKVIVLGETAAGWVVQVATYRADGREEAFEWLGKIRRAGYKPFLKTVEFPGRTLYRLRLGAYPERWMAEEVERRLLNNFPNEGLRPRIMQQDD
jgi:cell division septation protein DedD